MSGKTEKMATMPTKLRAKDTALIIVDAQVSSFDPITNIEPIRLRDNLVALATAARILSIPIILTAGRKPGIDGVFLPELLILAADASFIERTHADAFDDPSFARSVEALQKSNLIIAGLALEIGVCFSAISARRAGYGVCVPIDCCGSVDDASLRAGLAQFASAGIHEYTLAALLIALLGDFAMPIAPKILALIKTRGQNVARTFGN
jgi:nicotinamidase-related amidase